MAKPDTAGGSVEQVQSLQIDRRIDCRDQRLPTVPVASCSAPGRAEHPWNSACCLESLSEAVFWADEAARLAYANEAFCDLLGGTREELLGTRLSRFMPDLQPEGWRERWREAKERGSAAWQTECRTGNGVAFPAELRMNHLEFGGQEYALVLVRDITEPTRMRKALEESERRYRALFECAGESILLVRGERFVDCNRKALEMYGCTREQILGRTLADFSPALQPDGRDSREKAREMIARALAEEVLSFEWQHCRSDGTPFDVQVSLNRAEILGEFHLLAVLKDVTERKRAEGSLRESERRLRELLETVHLMAIVLDTGGNITFGNDYFLRLTGWRIPDAMGQNWIDTFIPESQREEMKKIFRAAISGSELPAHYQNSILTRDGGSRLVEWDSTVLRDLAGNIVGIASLGRDITEHSALESQYRQAQKLASIGRLAGGVAHDFNNLLTVINGYGELLLNTLPEKDPARAGVLEICAAGERGAALTRQLLAFSQRQALQPRFLNLNAVVLEAQSMLQRLIGDDIELITRLDSALGLVRADASQIHQVLMNLAVNARDAMPHGGKLVIESVNVDLAESGAAPGIPAGAYARLSVTDNGCGIREKVKARLFEPFFTTKERGKGTGLGLSTVYGIISQSGGHILVDSAPGAGATFRIFLPRTQASAVAADDRPADQTPPRGAETILVAEDHPEVRELAAEILRGRGYQVLEAAGGAEALRVSQAHSGEISLTVADVGMPGMNGFELADRLERTRPGMRVLFTSGDAERAVAEHGGLPPNTACLQKPFSANVLARKVREVLDQRRGRGCVLVVNGEALFRTLLGQILSHAGYEVLEARNGKGAIAAMRRRVPDVAIVDLAMPGRDRLETIRGIGAGFPRVPLIAISASRANPKRTSVLLRVRETLAKPVAPRDVLRAVQDALQAEKPSQGGPEHRPYTENPRGTGNPRRSSPLSGL